MPPPPLALILLLIAGKYHNIESYLFSRMQALLILQCGYLDSFTTISRIVQNMSCHSNAVKEHDVFDNVTEKRRDSPHQPVTQRDLASCQHGVITPGDAL